MSISFFNLRQHDGEGHAAYLELRDYPDVANGIQFDRSVDIHQIIPGYNGPALRVDLDKDGLLLGIEITYAEDPESGR